METETIYEVVKKLIGAAEPVGETNADARRLDNLVILTGLTDLLLADIAIIARHNKDRIEYSMRKAGKHAHDFMISNGITDY